MKKFLTILAVVASLAVCGAAQAGQRHEPKHQDRDYDRYERHDRDRDHDRYERRDRDYDRDHDRDHDRDYDHDRRYRDRDDSWSFFGWDFNYDRDRDNHPPIRIRPLTK